MLQTPVNKSVAAIMATRLLNISRGAKDFQNVADIIYTAGVVRRISPFIRCDVGVRLLITALTIMLFGALLSRFTPKLKKYILPNF